MGFGDAAYTGVATLGRVQAIIGALVMVLIMLVMWGFGAMILMDKKKRVKGTVKSAHLLSSTTSTLSNGTTEMPVYHMALVVNYQFAGQDRTSSIASDSSTQYVEGQSIDLRLDPEFPDLPTEGSGAPRWLGGVLIIGGLAMGAVSVVHAYFTVKSKEYAAVTGTMGLATDIKHIL